MKKSDETEEFNTWGRSKPATVAKSDWDPVTDVTLETDTDRQIYLKTT
jgi:hypothetical protein